MKSVWTLVSGQLFHVETVSKLKQAKQPPNKQNTAITTSKNLADKFYVTKNNTQSSK